MVLGSCTSQNSSFDGLTLPLFFHLRIASNERTINGEKVVVDFIAYWSNSTTCKNDP